MKFKQPPSLFFRRLYPPPPPPVGFEVYKFKWNSDLNTLRDFWIAELEGGDENNLVSVNSNGHTDVLKFESVTVNFYASTKTLQVQGSQKDHYVKKLRSIVENGTKAQDTLRLCFHSDKFD